MTVLEQKTLSTFFKPKNEKVRDRDVDDEISNSAKKSRDSKDELITCVFSALGKSWIENIGQELQKEYFKKLVNFLKKEYESNTVYPPKDKIYRWSHCCAFSDVKVVILGQDPYHGPKQAMGLCFSVPDDVLPPPSLINIYKELEMEYPPSDSDKGFVNPGTGNLESWAEQGVLLLNSTLTVRSGQAFSHVNQGWETFTDAVIKALYMKKKHLVFILWGSHAQKKARLMNITSNGHLILSSAHPSPLSSHKGFFGCGHFKKANEYLVQHGERPIDWNLKK